MGTFFKKNLAILIQFTGIIGFFYTLVKIKIERIFFLLFTYSSIFKKKVFRKISSPHQKKKNHSSHMILIIINNYEKTDVLCFYHVYKI